MTVRNKQPLRNPGGAAITYFAAAAGDQIQNPGPDCVLLVKNGSGAPITVTIVTPGTLPNGDVYPDKAFIVAATSDGAILVGNEYVDANNQASLSWSATATVSWAALSTA